MVQELTEKNVKEYREFLASSRYLIDFHIVIYHFLKFFSFDPSEEETISELLLIKNGFFTYTFINDLGSSLGSISRYTKFNSLPRKYAYEYVSSRLNRLSNRIPEEERYGLLEIMTSDDKLNCEVIRNLILSLVIKEDAFCLDYGKKNDEGIYIAALLKIATDALINDIGFFNLLADDDIERAVTEYKQSIERHATIVEGSKKLAFQLLTESGKANGLISLDLHSAYGLYIYEAGSYLIEGMFENSIGCFKKLRKVASDYLYFCQEDVELTISDINERLGKSSFLRKGFTGFNDEINVFDIAPFVGLDKENYKRIGPYVYLAVFPYKKELIGVHINLPFISEPLFSHPVKETLDYDSDPLTYLKKHLLVIREEKVTSGIIGGGLYHTAKKNLLDADQFIKIIQTGKTVRNAIIELGISGFTYLITSKITSEAEFPSYIKIGLDVGIPYLTAKSYSGIAKYTAKRYEEQHQK